MKKKESTRELREELNTLTPDIQLHLGEHVKKMRQITKKTQIEFANLLGIAPRIIIDLENSKGNPTLKTLRKIAQAFGFDICFCKSRKD